MRTKNEHPRVQTTAVRALRVLKALKGQTLTGLSNKQLADSLGYTACDISLALNTLEAEGLVVKLENGRYAHSIQMLQIAQAHTDHINRMQGKIHEINARIQAGGLP